MDRIGYPHVRVRSDTGFGSDTPKSISNLYPFKKIGFYPYPYPLSSQQIFLLFDRIGSGRKSTNTNTFAISIHMILHHFLSIDPHFHVRYIIPTTHIYHVDKPIPFLDPLSLLTHSRCFSISLQCVYIRHC